MTSRTHTMAVLHKTTLIVSICILANKPQQLKAQIDDWFNGVHTSPRASTLIAGDTILIVDTENDTGEDIFDDSLKQALVIELEQSPFFNLLPEAKVRAAMQSLGGQKPSGLSASQSQTLCNRLGGKAILKAGISKTASLYRVTIIATNCSSGQQMVQAPGEQGSKDEILQLLTTAALTLRERLGEPSETLQRYQVSVRSATNSLEALKAYSTGLAVQQEQGDVSGAPLFEKAVEADPAFPQPYVALASVYRNLRLPERALQNASKAYGFRERVNARARLRIQAAYFSTTGPLQDEIGTYQVWEKQYPREFAAHNNLGDDYFGIGNLEGALAEYQEAVHLSPTIASYSNLMGAELSLNRLDDVQRTFNEALAHHLDGRYVRQTYYWLAFVRGEESKMEEQVRWAIGKPGDEDVLLSLQSDSEAYHGQMGQARALTQRAVDSAIRSKSSEAAALWQVNSALREAELGNKALAERGARAALQIKAGRDVEMFAALALARCGNVEEAKSIVRKLESTYTTDTLMKLYWLPTIRAAIALSSGDASSALKALEPTREYELGGAGTTINYLYPAYIRGQAYLLARQPAAAKMEFQKLLDHPGIVLNFVTGATVNIELARVSAAAGDYQAARKYYEAAFSLWRHADQDFFLMRESHSEFARLP